jgi:hypothetical protein
MVGNKQIMKILLVSRSVFSNNPQSIRFRSFIEVWKKNHDISLLTFEDNTPKKIPTSAKGIKISTIKKNKISRLITPSLIHIKSKSEVKGNIKLVNKLASKIRFRKFFFPDVYVFTLKRLKKKLDIMISNNNYDIIIVSAFPFSFQSLGFFLKKKVNKNTIIVYDTGDPFHGNSSRASQGLLHKFFSKYYENYFLSHFDYLIVASQIMKEHYMHKTNISRERKNIFIIPQGIHTSELNKPIAYEKKVIKKEKISRLIYAGNFYKELREPFQFFNAVNLIKNIEVNIYGNTSNYFKVKNDNIKFHGSIDYIQVIKQYMFSDIVVFFDNNNGIQIPGKVYEILSLNKPILFIYSNPQSPTIKIVEDYDFVFLVKNETESIKQKILEIINFKGIFNYNFQIDNYSWSTLANEYLDLIK